MIFCNQPPSVALHLCSVIKYWVCFYFLRKTKNIISTTKVVASCLLFLFQVLEGVLICSLSSLSILIFVMLKFLSNMPISIRFIIRRKRHFLFSEQTCIHESSMLTFYSRSVCLLRKWKAQQAKSGNRRLRIASWVS